MNFMCFWIRDSIYWFVALSEVTSVCDVHCVIIVLLPVLLQFTKISCSQVTVCTVRYTITSRTKRLRVMNLDEQK